MSAFLITHSLLSSYCWAFVDKDHYDEFLMTLRRQPKEATIAMLNGRKFEALVSEACAGKPPEHTHPWFRGVMEVAGIVQGSQEQVRVSRKTRIQEGDYLLYGILDGLMAGTIYDVKFSKSYRPCKYWDSTQHPMYFALVPEAKEFRYVVSDGSEVWQETYYPFSTEPIEVTIKHFLRFLSETGLTEIYEENWRARG